MNGIKLKKKLANHITKNGKKQISEKIVAKTFKRIQKSQKKNYTEIIKLSITNATPTFKIIELTDKKRKKKSIKEVPTFLSNYNFRTSWGIKYLAKTSKLQINQATFLKKMENEFIVTAKFESQTITLKNSFQNKVLQEKKYFRYYRW
jgi:ribosomal protein S7